MDDFQNNQPDKDNKAVIIGFILILIVFAVTLGRHYWPQEKKEVPESAAKPSETDKALEGKKMGAAELLKISNDRNVVIWDMRDAESFKKEHILGSKNINPDNIESMVSRHDSKKKYILVDDTGEMSLSLIENMFMEDKFKNIFYLDGGIMTWKEDYGSVITEGDPYSLEDQSKVSYISSDDLKKIVDQSSASLFIIDVRKRASFDDGHIQGAVNIFLDDLETNGGQIPMGKKIILYDNDGLWAFQGAVRLADMGIHNSQALSDGLDAWKEKGYAIEK